MTGLLALRTQAPKISSVQPWARKRGMQVLFLVDTGIRLAAEFVGPKQNENGGPFSKMIENSRQQQQTIRPSV